MCVCPGNPASMSHLIWARVASTGNLGTQDTRPFRHQVFLNSNFRDYLKGGRKRKKEMSVYFIYKGQPRTPLCINNFFEPSQDTYKRAVIDSISFRQEHRGSEK